MNKLSIPPFETLREAIDFYFIRHGQSVANREHRIQGRSESPLSPEGRRQAKESAHWLAALQSINGLYSSPLARSLETATLIGKTLGQKVQVDQLLIELDTGIFSNLTAEEAMLRYPVEWTRFQSYSWEGVPQAESIKSLAQRATAYWQKLIGWANDRQGGAFLSVTHGGTIQWLLKCTLGARPRWMPLIPASNCGIFHLHVQPLIGSPAKRGGEGFFSAWRRMNYISYKVDKK